MFSVITGFANLLGGGASYPLHDAAALGYLDSVKYRLENGYSVNAIDNNHCTALHHAAKNGQLEVLEFLIEAKAIVDAKNISGRTALSFAAEYGKLEVAKYLIGCGANVRASNIIDDPQVGRSPIHYAAMSGNIEIMQCFLDNKADINSKSITGNTPIFYAAEYKQPQILDFLIKKGAETSVTNDANESIADYFFKKTINDPKKAEAKEVYQEIIKLFVDHKVPLSYKTSSNNELLEYFRAYEEYLLSKVKGSHSIYKEPSAEESDAKSDDSELAGDE